MPEMQTVEITEKAYRTLPGTGAARLLNALAGEVFLTVCQAKDRDGNPFIVEFFEEGGQWFRRIKKPVFVEES